MGLSSAQGVKFHDGSDMTAEDVVASLERAKTCTDISNYTTTVETVTAEDDYTIRITTPTPTATLLYDLSNHGNAILPKELIDSGNDFGKNPIGTGPYKFVDWQSGVSITFEAFDDYYAGAPAIKDMTWKIIPEGSAAPLPWRPEKWISSWKWKPWIWNALKKAKSWTPSAPIPTSCPG